MPLRFKKRVCLCLWYLKLFLCISLPLFVFPFLTFESRVQWRWEHSTAVTQSLSQTVELCDLWLNSLCLAFFKYEKEKKMKKRKNMIYTMDYYRLLYRISRINMWKAFKILPGVWYLLPIYYCLEKTLLIIF